MSAHAATAATPFPDWHAERAPDKPAWIMAGSGEVVTYRRLVDRSRRIARLLRERGLRTGDGMAILMGNGPAFLAVAWAPQRSGLRYTAISTRLTPPEIGYILDDCGAGALVVDTACAERAAAALEHAPGVRVRLCADGAPAGFEDLRPLLDQVSAEPLEHAVEGVDMLYSSGTTGRPKGIEVDLPGDPLGTAPGLVDLLRTRWGFGPDTVYLSPAPLYHSAPLRFNMAVHRSGGTSIVMERFDPVHALELIQRHRVTHTQLVPTMFIRMLKLPEAERARFDVSSLRAVIHAAAPCPPDVKRAMIEWFGPVIEEYYAATENNLFCAITSAEALERPGSVGRALAGTPHILDDLGRELPPGETGTIWSEGGLEFTYHNDPEKTAASRNERGWSTIGDLGYLDDDGYLFLSDRRADLVLSGGVNVYPREVEDVLVGHPAVADVAVFGLPHEELGEVVKAVVQPEDPAAAGPELEAELLAWLEGRLARYKAPRSIDFLDELPRHPTGKLYKRLLRERYLAKEA